MKMTIISNLFARKKMEYIAFLTLSFLLLFDCVLSRFHTTKHSGSDNEYKCGYSNMGLPRRRILNGKDIVEGDWPWIVYLSSGCTGSIIAPRHVLSAAHCAFQPSKDGSPIKITNGTVVLGRNRKSRKQRSQISKIYVHPNFDFYDFSSPDLAIFELSKAIVLGQDAKRICLPQMFHEYYGQIGIVVGWGADLRTDTNEVPHVAQETVIPINRPLDCESHLKNMSYNIEFNAKDFICGGGTLRGTEGGDSGGPLMINEKGRWFQVGLTSYGEMGKTEDGFFDVGAYTRVSEHCDWISKITEFEAKCLDIYNI